MDETAPELACPFCRTYNREDRVFCLRCSRRLLLPAPNSIRVADYISPADKSGLDAIRGTEPLPHLIQRFAVPGVERTESWLAKYGARIRPPSRLDSLIRACGEVLGLERLPKAYVAPVQQANAFTTGKDEDPLLVICSPVLDFLGYTEMEGLVSHELAHVKSKHVLYHTLAESVASGVQLLAPVVGAGLLSLPIKMLLLSWYRESEISADRAALLVLGDYRAFESLMVSLMRYDAPDSGAFGSLTELLQTHPSFERRLRLAREYYGSSEFRTAKLRMKDASWSLASICGYCGTMAPRSEAFCPGCARSKT